ncbi:MAG TPA: AsmA family protein [Steroidobacteraceae bacterium]|nr:AsmA family protein [Steroidobacteraceae bacterium]
MKWGALVLLALLVALLVICAILERNADALRGPISRSLSHHLNRPVRIDGRLTLHLLSLEPSIVVKDIHVANPAWAQLREMARIGQLTASLSVPDLLRAELVVPHLEIDDADVNLLRDASERANWDFGGPPQPSSSQPTRLPVVRSLRIDGGHLLVQDAIRKLKFDGAVRASQGGGATTLQLDGNGNINGATFKMFAHGDPLFTADRSKPYSFQADVQAGATHVSARATLTKPFDLGALDTEFTITGDDLADVYYLTSLALPNTAPYSLTARVKREGNRVIVSDLRARFAKSDLSGQATIDIGGARPVLTADIDSRSLDLVDIAPSLGAPTKTARPGQGSLATGQQSVSTAPAEKGPTAVQPAQKDATKEDSTKEDSTKGSAQKGSTKEGAIQQASTQQDATPQQSTQSEPTQKNSTHEKLGKRDEGKTAAKQSEAAAAGGLLLPDAHLQVERVRGMDATVHYQALTVVAQKVPIRHLDFTLRLKDGVIDIQPLSLSLPQGKISGTVRIDASRDVPDVTLDMRLNSIQLSQFRPRNSAPLATGTLVGRVQLHGHGSSVHDAAATADGIVTVAVPHGEVREAFAELTGIDIARGLGLLLAHNQQETGIRCGVANFQAQNGVLNAKDIVFDTDTVLVTGKGDIDLRNEKLNLTMNGQPKKFRFFRIKSPIALGGTLRKPSIGLKPGNTPAQAGVAVALGTLLTPVAAALAFIDPGLAKSADCSALLDEAKGHGAPVKQAEVSNAARTPSR